jgi:hypothetical protein
MLSAWLRLMVFAALYQFGLKSGVGADTLSHFFKTILILNFNVRCLCLFIIWGEEGN